MTTRPLISAVALAAALALAAGCTPSTSTSVSPAPVTSISATPSPTPSKTYGPNQTAALAAVTGYYTWWNTARKNPSDPRFLELAKYWDLYATAYSDSIGDINGLATLRYHQVGDMVVVDLAPESENASKITVTVCLDRTGTSLVNSAGATVDPRDRRTGATIPSSQVFTRRVFMAVTKPNASGVWVITDLTGGTSSC